MRRLLQALPSTDEGVNEEARDLIGALEPALDKMNEYECKIVGNIKEAGSCNRPGLTFLRAMAYGYLTEEEEEN